MHTLLTAALEGERPEVEDFCDSFGFSLPLLYELKHCPQDAQWHAEGDVHVHTDMVLNEVYDMIESEAKHLSETHKLALIMSALLHDICKPDCTREKEIRGRICIVSPRHEEKGRSYLATRLYELDLPNEVIRLTLELVGNHQLPRHFIMDDAHAGKYARLARKAPLELFYWLERADMLGRECVDRDQQVEVMELFKLQAQEYGLWQVAHPYTAWQEFFAQTEMSETAREFALAKAIMDFEDGLIASKEEALARSFELRNGFARLTLMCGPSGSGKSRWIENNSDETTQVISLDSLRQELCGKRESQKMNGQVLQKAQELLKQALRHKQDIIWDATCLRKDQRAKLLRLAHDYHAMTRIIAFQASEDEYIHGNRTRPHSVPESVLLKQLDSFEFPEINEAHQLISLNKMGEILYKS